MRDELLDSVGETTQSVRTYFTTLATTPLKVWKLALQTIVILAFGLFMLVSSVLLPYRILYG